jgi:hypothetical protein
MVREYELPFTFSLSQFLELLDLGSDETELLLLLLGELLKIGLKGEN